MTRQEFTKKTKAQAFLRCNGKCENKHCGVKLTKDITNYDHKVSDKICRDQGIKSNTLSNCQCLCVECHTIIKTRADMAEIIKRRKQDKKYSGDASGLGEAKAVSPPVKYEWAKREIPARPFDKKPDNYKYRWNK